jgi:hypothetical protein
MTIEEAMERVRSLVNDASPAHGETVLLAPLQEALRLILDDHERLREVEADLRTSARDYILAAEARAKRLEDALRETYDHLTGDMKDYLRRSGAMATIRTALATETEGT